MTVPRSCEETPVPRPLIVLCLVLAAGSPAWAEGTTSRFFVELRGGAASYALDDVDTILGEADALMVEPSPVDDDRFGGDGYRRTQDGPIEGGALFGLLIGRSTSGGWRYGGGLESLGGTSRTTASGANGTSVFDADLTAWNAFGHVARRLPWSPGGIEARVGLELGLVVPTGRLALERDGSTEEVEFDGVGFSSLLLLRVERQVGTVTAPFVEVGVRRAVVRSDGARDGDLAALTGPEVTLDLTGPLVRLGLHFGSRP